MADPQPKPAWEALHAEVCRIDFRYCRDWQSRVVDVVLANIPLVMDAAMEAGSVVECTDPEGDVTWKIR